MPLIFSRSLIGTAGDSYPSAAASVVFSMPSTANSLINLQSVNGTQPASDGITAINQDPITGYSGGSPYGHLVSLKVGTYEIKFVFAEVYSGTDPGSATVELFYGKRGSGPGDIVSSASFSATDTTSVTENGSYRYKFENVSTTTNILTFTHPQANISDYGLLCRISTGGTHTKRLGISVQRTS